MTKDFRSNSDVSYEYPLLYSILICFSNRLKACCTTHGSRVIYVPKLKTSNLLRKPIKSAN